MIRINRTPGGPIAGSVARAGSDGVRQGARRAGIVVAAVVSALALSSCGTAEAGSAAVIGDRRISVASVQSGYTSMLALTGPDNAFTQSDILDLLILEPYYVGAASSIGRGISTEDAPLYLNVDPAKFTPNPTSSRILRAYAALNAITSSRTAPEVKASLTKIADQLKADGVHINPRFGAGINYNLTAQMPFAIVPAKQNWIASTPAPTVAVTPTP